MAVFVQDSFTDVDGTALQAHVGEVGAVWTPHTAAYPATAAVIEAGRVRFLQARGNSSTFYASGVPSGAEYDVECDLYINAIHGESVGVIARAHETVNTMYHARWYYDGGIELYRFVNGSATQIGNVGYPVTTGQTIHLKLEVRDAAKRVLVDGVEVISSPDNAITDAGRAGIRSYRQRNDPAPGTGVHVDNFVATDLSGGTPEPVASMLEGLQATLPIIPHLSLTAPVASEITGLTAPLPLAARASLTAPVASEISSLTAAFPLVPRASLTAPVASEVGSLTATLPLVSRVALTVPVASGIGSLTATFPLVPRVALTVPDEAPAETLTGLSVALPLFGRMSATVPVASTVTGLSAPLPLPPHLSATAPTASTLSLKSVLTLAPELSLSVPVASTMALSTGLSLVPSLQMSVPVAGRLELLAALPLGVRLSFAQGEIITPYTTIRLDRDYYQVIALLQDYHQAITLLQDYYQALGII